MKIHSRPSARAEKIFGADLRPKGRVVSMKRPLCQAMPSSLLSSGCTGTFLYAWAMSSLASIAPLPTVVTNLAASSTEAYQIVQRSGDIPSLTLASIGDDKSSMSLHFPG